MRWLCLMALAGLSGSVVPTLASTAPIEQEANGGEFHSSPRGDANSQTAHLQLVEKAKKGGIDLYFVGDSITRRWGTSDTLWAANLANWKANFYGWNAGNFGWGADNIQNILWRLENGELDGVNPQVIVILAGTNNIAGPSTDTQVATITQGIKALVAICQAKAPEAKIILTGIFPRNDNMAALATINRVNQNISRMADGKTIRYINVNDKLADRNGVLFEGMTIDRLHPSVKGYQVWADGLKPILTELLGPPAATDHSPPPSGDPSAAHK